MLIHLYKINHINKIKIIYIILFYFFIHLFNYALANNIYKIEKISSDGIITLSLSLSPDKDNVNTIKLFMRQDLATPQVENIRCDDNVLVQDSSGYWLVPSACNKVYWDVKSKQVDDQFVDIAEQMTLNYKKAGWILFSESSSLLRIHNNTDPLSLLVSNKTIPLLGATAYNNGWLVPPEDGAPEFFVIGRPSIQVERIAGFTVSYVIDNPKQINLLELLNSHKKILLYFSKLLSIPTKLPKNEKSLLLILIGIDEKNSQVNGAAGRRSFIANYIVGKNKTFNLLNEQYSLLTLAHEQFHQFVDMVRFDQPGESSVWIEESLAQYYAIKSLQSILLKDDLIKFNKKFLQTNDAIKLKFIEIEQQIAQGNYENYPLCYSQGAQFWYEFDQALLTSSNNSYGLDYLLPELIKGESKEGQLPQQFIEKAYNIAGNKIDSLLMRYVK